MEIVQDKWKEILQRVRDEHELSEISFTTWIEPLTIHSVEDNLITILVPSEKMGLDYVSKKYTLPIKVAIAEITGVNYEIRFILPEEVKQEKAPAPVQKNLYVPNLNPKYTFDTFVVGSNNKFAHAASLAVAESPGEIYNPLFLYGGVGLGKTHLMHSIAHFILQKNPSSRILYVTSEEFTNELIEALKMGKTSGNESAISKFRDKYRNNDVLLIDDIQFIIGKDSTQIEFFNTFEALYQSGKQLVISSDKPPSQMEHLDMRYRSRFTSGMTIDIQPPDYEMSMAILRNKQENSDIQLNEEILDYIATNIKSNIRILEGAYNKILLFARFTKPKDNKIDLNMAKEALKDFISPNENMVITADYIIDIVADHFNLDKEAILSEKRTKTVSIPRQICMYLCNELTNLTLTEIAVKLKRSNHSTVIHGVHKIEQDILVDKELEETINVLKKKLNS